MLSRDLGAVALVTLNVDVSEPVDFEILVTERDRPDYDDVVLSLRRFGMAGGQGFSRWLASPSSGRFLIIQFHVESFEEMIWNCSTEAELIEDLGRRYLAFLDINRRSSRPPDFYLHCYVTPAVHAKLQRMFAEIKEIEAEARRNKPQEPQASGP